MEEGNMKKETEMRLKTVRDFTIALSIIYFANGRHISFLNIVAAFVGYSLAMMFISN